MTLTTLRELKLKDGRTIPAGTACAATFPEDRPSLILVTPPGFEAPVRVRASSGPMCFEEIEPITMEEIEGAISDSACPSLLGEIVEPDGRDHHGAPSWLLALGLI